MLTLSESQLDALRIPVHRNMRSRLLADLESQGAVEDLSGPEPAISITEVDSGAKSRLTFRPDGLPKAIESGAGRKYGLDYDESGLLTGLVVPSREPYRFGYSGDGTLETASQGKDAVYRFAHDKRGEITSISWPDKRVLQFDRHPNGKLRRVTDRTGAVTEYAYDDLFRLRTVTGPLGKKLEFIREPEQNRFSLIYPNGSRESIEWIPGTPRFRRKMPDGSLLEYTVDSKNRVAAIAWPGDQKARFKYTAEDEISSVEHGKEFARFRRDLNGHVTLEETPSGDVLPLYSKQGRLLRLTNPFGDSIAYEYDADGFVTSISAWGRTVRLKPGPDGQSEEIHFGDSVVERRRYGPAGRMTEAQVTSAVGTVLSRQSYKYDACERLVELQDPDRINGFVRRLTYDLEDRLIAEDSTRFGAKFKYDARGNMVQASSASSTETVQFGDMDEPVRVNGRPLKYDACGNLIQWDATRGTLKCSYDARGLMTHCSVGGKVVEFGYDALGRRIRKSSTAGVWRFGWFGLQLLWEEFTAPGGNPVRREYLFLPGTFTAIAFRENNRVYWLQSDVRGAVVRAFDESGTVGWQGNYESFGAVQVYGKRVRQPLRLMGQYEDEETGLYYNLARYYSSDSASYLGRDPRWYDPRATNYSYSRNDPWDQVDPTAGLPSFISTGLSMVSQAATSVSSSVSDATSAVGTLVTAVASKVMAGLPVCIPCALKAMANIALKVVAGAVDAFASDNLLGQGRHNINDTAFKVGQALGDFAAMVTGGMETIIGAGGEAGGIVLDATGVGAVIGVPVNVGAAAIAAHGVTAVAAGGAHLAMSVANSGGGGSGGAGGDGAENPKEGAPSSEYKDATKGSSVKNVETKVTPEEFGKNLEEQGYQKSASQDGKVINYSKGDSQYSVYPKSRSTGGPSAQLTKNGEMVLKIRFK